MGALLSFANLADAGTVTVSSQAVSLGPAALLTPQINDVWRSDTTGTATVWAEVDLGSAKTINVVAIAAPRDNVLPTSSATIRLTAGSTSGGATALDTGAATFTMSPCGVWGWRSTAGVSARYWRVTFGMSASDSYLQLGRIWVGAALITSRGYAFGASRGGRDPGTVSRTGMTGTRYATLGRPYRIERFTLPALTTAEAAQIQTAAMAVGTTGQVFAARSDAALGDGIFGAFTEPPAVVRPYPQVWTADLQIEEDA